MTSDKFKVNWQAYDGYAGGSRPQSFNISADEIDFETEEDARNYFNEILDQEFRECVYPSTDDEDSFVEWAMAQMKKQREEAE